MDPSPNDPSDDPCSIRTYIQQYRPLNDPTEDSYNIRMYIQQYSRILEGARQPQSLPSPAFTDTNACTSEELPPIWQGNVDAQIDERPVFAALFDLLIALPQSPTPGSVPGLKVFTFSPEERVHLAWFVAEECLSSSVQAGCTASLKSLAYLIVRAAMRIDHDYLYEVDFAGAGYVSAGSSSSSSSGSDSGSASGSQLGSELDVSGPSEADTARWKGAGVSMEKLIALVEGITSALGNKQKEFAEVLGEKIISATKFNWDKSMFPSMRTTLSRESHLEVHMRRAFRFSAFLGELFVRDIISRSTVDMCIAITLENQLDTRGEACLDQLVAVAVVLDTVRGKMWDANLILDDEGVDASVSLEKQLKKAKENAVSALKIRLERAVNEIVATEVGYARTQQVNHKREVQTWMRRKGLRFWDMQAKYVMGRLNAIVYRWSGI